MSLKVLRVLLCSALMVAGTFNAEAVQTNWSGMWFDPAYSGQGMDLAEYSDGVLIAHYFGYQDDGTQMWLVAIGRRDGDTAVLEAWITQGGNSGESPVSHMETEWGTFEIREESGGLYLSASPFDQSGWTRSLLPLYLPAPAEQPAARIRIETPLRTISGTRWIEQPGQSLVSMTALPSEVRITVVEGTLTITDTYAEGPHNPTLTGVVRGQVLNAGDSALVRCDVDPDKRRQQSGLYDIVDFGVYTAELGQILQLSAQVAEDE